VIGAAAASAGSDGDAGGDAGGGRAAAGAARPARARLHGLTGLRFVAAAWVFAYHFLVLTVAGAPWWVARVQNAGHAAVSLFFVLSGFVLAYNYAEPLAAGRVSRARFWWLRLARVWPLYALVALVEIPLALHGGVAPGRVGAATAADLVGLQAWIPSFTFVGNSPGWSVSVELFFYAAFPWLVGLAGASGPAGSSGSAGSSASAGVAGRARAVLAACLVLAVAAAATPALVPSTSGAATFLKCGPLLRLPEFVAGIALGRAFVHRRRPLAPAAATALAALALAAVAAIVLAAGALPRYFLHALLLPAFALGLWAVADGGARWLGGRALVLAGEASYALYLLQLPLFEALHGRYEWSLPRLCALFALLFALSIAVHFAVEKPAQRWLVARAPRP
jgi:peptidoglycan/LPS O-acetylase OafA/YrhL